MSDSDWNDGFKAGIEAAAKVCDAQALEPECPERAQYCADAIRALKRPEAKPECNHAWVSARNEVIQSGEICRWCFAVRPEGDAHER